MYKFLAVLFLMAVAVYYCRSVAFIMQSGQAGSKLGSGQVLVHVACVSIAYTSNIHFSTSVRKNRGGGLGTRLGLMCRALHNNCYYNERVATMLAGP